MSVVSRQKSICFFLTFHLWARWKKTWIITSYFSSQISHVMEVGVRIKKCRLQLLHLRPQGHHPVCVVYLHMEVYQNTCDLPEICINRNIRTTGEYFLYVRIFRQEPVFPSLFWFNCYKLYQVYLLSDKSRKIF